MYTAHARGDANGVETCQGLSARACIMRGRMKRNSLARFETLAPYAILLLAAALRFYQLGHKSLWGDEIAQATWSAWEWARLWQEFRAPPDFILHFVLVHLAQQIGTHEFWIRFPSAVTSLLCVPLTYVVANRLTNRTTALLAMLLMAVALYQIWYAQDARMYAALGCFALASLYFFLRLIFRLEKIEATANLRESTRMKKKDSRRIRATKSVAPIRGSAIFAFAGLTFANSLAIYTHLFGVFPILIEGFIAFGILAAQWIRARRVTMPRGLFFLGASFFLTALLALPLVSGTVPYVLQGAQPAVPENIAPTQPFQFSFAFVWGLLGEFGLGASEFWRTLISLALALVGAGALWLHKPRGAWIATMWLVLPLALLFIAQPRHGVAARYLIFLQPMYLLLIASGILYGTRMVADERGFFLTKFFRVNPRLSASKMLFALIGFIVLGLVVAPPLDSLYHRAKLNDWRAIANYVAQHAEAGDLIFGERNTPNMNAFAYYVPNLLRYSTPPTTLEAMQNAVKENRRVWSISVGDYFDREGDGWARKNLAVISAQEWRAETLVYEAASEFSFPQSEAHATIFFHNGEIPSVIRYAGKQGYANDGPAQVRVHPNETLEAKLNLGGGETRLLEIEFASKKNARFDVRVNGKLVAAVREENADKGERVLRWQLEEEDEVVLVQIKNVSNEFPLLVRSLALSGE